MMRHTKPIAIAIGAISFLMADRTASYAAGAIAVGHCDRHGYSYGYDSEAAAKQRALAECGANGDSSCEVVVTLHGACGAFAVSGCEARGWGYAGSRAAAENIALSFCRRYGGDDCHVAAWVCDGGP